METPWTKEEDDLLVDLYRRTELYANYSRRGARLVAIRAITARFSGKSQSIYALVIIRLTAFK